MDGGHRRAREAGSSNRQNENRRVGSVHAQRCPVPDCRAEQHHPLDAEVQHSGTLGEELAQGGKEQRRSVEDGLREDDHLEVVVDAREHAGAHWPTPLGQ